MSILNLLIRADAHEVDAAKKSIGGMKDSLKELASEIPGLESVMGSLSGLMEKMGGLAEGAAAGFIGLAAAAAAAVIAVGALGIAMAFKWSEKIDALADLGEKLGITADQTYYLKSAMENAGLSIDSLMTAQERLAKSMAKSGDESKGAGAAFERLGISTESANGQLRGTNEVLADIAKKYEVHNLNTSQAADLALVLGKNYREVLIAAAEAAKAQEVYNEMLDAGVGMSEAAQKAASDQETQQMRVGATMNQMGSILVEMVIPAWNSLCNWFVESFKRGGAVAQVFNVIANSTNVLVEVISFLVQGLGILIKAFFDVGGVAKNVFGGIYDAMAGDVSGGLDRIAHAADGVSERLKGYGKEFMTLIQNSKGGLDKSFGDLFDNRDRVGEAQQSMLNKTNKDGKTSIVPRGATAGGRANPTDSGASETDKATKALEQMVKQLNNQLMTQENLSKAEMVHNQLLDKKFDLVRNTALAQKAMDLAHLIDTAQSNKAADEYNKALEKQLQTLNNMNDVEKAQEDLKDKKYKFMDEEKRKQILINAARVDADKANKLVASSTNAMLDSAKSYLDSIEEEINARGKSDRQIKEDQELKKIDVALQKELNQLTLEHRDSIEAVTAAKAGAALASQRVKEASQQAQAADDNWLLNGVNKYEKSLGTWQEAASNLVNKGLKGIEEGLTSLFTGGDFSWKNFVKSIIDGLLSMAVQFLIMKPIMESFKEMLGGMGGGAGGGGGGWMSTAASFIGSFFNQGGIPENHAQGASMEVANTTQKGYAGGSSYNWGEAGSEVVAPLSKDAAGNTGIRIAGGGMGGVTNHFSPTVIINGDQSADPAAQQAQAQAAKEAIKKLWDEKYQDTYRAGGAGNRATLTM